MGGDREFLLEVQSHAEMFSSRADNPTFIPFNMSFSSKVRKFSCRVLDFRYIFLIFISRQNKLVCAQRAPKKITRFVPLRVHLLEIRRLGSWNTLPRQRSTYESVRNGTFVFADLGRLCRSVRLSLSNRTAKERLRSGTDYVELHTCRT